MHSSFQYAYDSQGRLVSRIESGASNDVVSQHELLDPRIQGPKHITEVVKNVEVSKSEPLNAPKLYHEATSKDSPPTGRHRVNATDLLNPFSGDIGGITSATPIFSVDHT